MANVTQVDNVQTVKASQSFRVIEGPQGPQGPQGERGEQGPAGPVGESGVHFGADAPTGSANVWIDPSGEPTGAESWTFTLEDGSTVTKAVVVIS